MSSTRIIQPSRLTHQPMGSDVGDETNKPAAMDGVSWQRVAERLQKERAAAIPTRWVIPPLKLHETLRFHPSSVDLVPRFVSHDETQITSMGVVQLASKIRDGHLSSIQVTQAFCHVAAIAQQLTNCLSEIMFAEAFEQARHLDEVLEATGKPVGPLHGVPVSLKDVFNVAGQRTSSGYIAFTKSGRKKHDALLVQLLRDAGAVIYCKTNVPQCLMSYDTVNNVYGRTISPWHNKLSAGGSSGGEGVLVAMRGSPLGMATDIAGSVRVPAAFNGLYGLKASASIVPVHGVEATNAGQQTIAAVVGPVAHSVDDLEFFMEVNARAQPWLREPLLRKPWVSQTQQMVQENRKLRIGIMRWDGVVMPHPYITRTIDDVSRNLAYSGHDVIEFTAHDHKRAWDEIMLPMYFTDGGRDIKQTLFAGNEPIFPAAKRLLDDPLVKDQSVHDVWKLVCAREAYRAEYLTKWAETAALTRSNEPMDVLICPVAPLQSFPHDFKPWWGYGAIWNLLDYPAGVIPTGRILSCDEYPKDYEPVNKLDKENMDIYCRKLCCDMPAAIQVVAPRHEDEKLVAAMKVIDGAINFETPPIF